MRTVLTHRFRQEEDPDIAPDAIVQSLGELPAIVAGWSGET